MTERPKKKQINRWEPYATILAAMPRFKKATASAREELGIPVDGIPYEDRGHWYQSLFMHPDANTGARYGFMIGHDLLPPNKKLLDIIDKIMADFNLDSRWAHEILDYILSGDGKLDAPFWRSASPVPKFNDVRLPKNKLRVTSLSISINKETSVQDIRDIWHEIKTYMAYMDSDIPKRRDPMLAKTVERYVKVCELREQCLTQNEIARGHSELKFGTEKDVSDFLQQVEKRFKPRKNGSIRAVPNLFWHD